MGPDAAVSRGVPEAARAVADAILYEGYLLYPYRKSSGKNRVRWQFGVLAPRDWVARHGDPDDASVAGSVESWYSVTECLLEPRPDSRLTVCLRFLQFQQKSVLRRTADGSFEPVEEVEIAGQTHLSFDEAVPQEFGFEVPLESGDGTAFPVDVAGCEMVEALDPETRIMRRRWSVAARVTVRAEQVSAPFRLCRLRVRVENAATDAPDERAPRERMLRRSLIATHTFLRLSTGSFVSQLDSPQWAQGAAQECRNVHTFPVLAGDPAQQDLMLSSPIILYDNPQIAPESPVDLFDATEIDEILSLRTMTLSEQEKREARATDPRAADLVDRAEAMPAEMLERLHGAVRSLRPVRQPEHWWEPGADADVNPQTDTVLVGGMPIGRGSRVRLRPRPRGTDAHDVFLAGRIGNVQAVLSDVDGSRQVAVTLEDDPGAELHGWYGRFRYFGLDEIEPVPAEGPVRP